MHQVLHSTLSPPPVLGTPLEVACGNIYNSNKCSITFKSFHTIMTTNLLQKWAPSSNQELTGKGLYFECSRSSLITFIPWGVPCQLQSEPLSYTWLCRPGTTHCKDHACPLDVHWLASCLQSNKAQVYPPNDVSGLQIDDSSIGDTFREALTRWSIHYFPLRFSIKCWHFWNLWDSFTNN